MPSKFKKHLTEKFAFLRGKKLLLAVSGGLDSMVMANLFRQPDYEVAIAHVNFNLRGAESDGDENFVKAFAAKNGVPVFVETFDTVAFAADNKLSVQVAARSLRYAWFGELLEIHGFDFVLTAHHADDNLETFLLNFSRGTGLDGLLGIPARNGEIIRPMLAFSRKEIKDYALENRIGWREDSSNTSDKYLRNQIRHGVVPALKNLNSNLLGSFAETLSHLQQSQSLARDAAALVYKQVAIEKEDKVIFRIYELTRLANYRAYLYHWLSGFGFTAWDDVYGLVEAQSGKRVLSADFQLLKDREVLILTPLEPAADRVFLIDKNTTHVNIPIKLEFERTGDISDANQNRIFADEEKIRWPLTLRKWQKGDWFHPLGMNGKKKVSKYFKDEKFSLLDKADAWLLCSGDRIVWIVGHRMDDRFKITDSTKNCLQITKT